MEYSEIEGTLAIAFSLILLLLTIIWTIKIYINYKNVLNRNRKKLLKKLNCSAEEALSRWLANLG